MVAWWHGGKNCWFRYNKQKWCLVVTDFSSGEYLQAVHRFFGNRRLPLSQSVGWQPSSASAWNCADNGASGGFMWRYHELGICLYQKCSLPAREWLLLSSSDLGSNECRTYLYWLTCLVGIAFRFSQDTRTQGTMTAVQVGFGTAWSASSKRWPSF